jgi:hypothetical protein
MLLQIKAASQGAAVCLYLVFSKYRLKGGRDCHIGLGGRGYRICLRGREGDRGRERDGWIDV